MARYPTPSSPTTARLRPSIDRPKLYTVLMLVVAVLVVGSGARYTVPDAAAATADETFDVGDFSVTLAQDGTVSIANKKTSTALLGIPDSAYENTTESEFRKEVEGLNGQLKRDLGWDLTLDTDRTRLRNEIQTFSKRLNDISQDTLSRPENSAIRELRGIIDEMSGTANCRGRCLVNLDYIQSVFSIAGTSLAAKHLAQVMQQGDQMDITSAAMGALILAGSLVAFFLDYLASVGNFPENLKFRVTVLMAALAGGILQPCYDIAVEYVTRSRKTMRDEVTDTAQHVESLASGAEPTNDYDLVKDEL